jgi:N-acetylmuramoyl-L-alanine amidase
MPGVLIETGFMTNPDEEKFLMSETGQDYIASAIFRAFRDYKDMMENKNTYIAGRNNFTDSGSASQTADTVYQVSLMMASGERAGSAEAESLSVVDAVAPVIFKVQVLASVKKIPDQDPQFKGFSDIEEYKVGNLYKYALNGGTSYRETITFCKKLQDKFPGAFVIAVRDKTVIPLEQALKEINLTTKNN